MNEQKPHGMGRVLWSVLAVVALIAVTAGVVYVIRGGEPDRGAAGDTSAVGSNAPMGTIDGTLFYVEYGEEFSELWSWTPGEEPRLRFKTDKSKLVNDARVSPDGRHLAYLTPGTAYPTYELVVRDLENDSERTIAEDLVQGGELCMDASWAPDGRPMILTQTGFDSAGKTVLKWFDIEAGTASEEIAVDSCFVRPVARGDDGFDLYYDGEDGEIFQRTPDGQVVATGLGPAVEAALGRQILDLGDLDHGGAHACVAIGEPTPMMGRMLDCTTVVDVAAKTVVYSPDGGFKGPVLFTADGGMLGRFSTFVSLMGADGTSIAKVDEPRSLKTFDLLTYVP